MKNYKIDYIWATKTHFQKFKMIELVSNMFLDNNTIKLEICKKKTVGKYPKYLKIKQSITK